MKLLHPALWVTDYDAVEEFYTGTLDFERSREFVGPDGATNYFLADERGVELQFKVDEDCDPVEPSGFDHIAVEVADVDEVFAEILDAWDSEVVLEPTDGENAVRIAFLTDPEGYTVELIQPLD